MTGALTYEVRRARRETEMEAILAIRHEVFCVEQGVPEREELDGRDDESLHLVAVSDEEVLATCRLLFVGNTVQFSRLAVSAIRPPPRRSPRRCWTWPTRRPGRPAPGASCSTPRPTPALSTRPPDTRPRGRVFMEAGIEHIAMEKYL